MPRFSIITPAYNAERTLTRAIESVLAQSISDWEQIIVDDGSTDHTAQIAQKFAEKDPRIMLVSGTHEGVALARLKGMRHAHGDFFARLDADDAMLPTYLEEVGRIYDAYPGTDIVSTNGYQVLADGSKVYYYTDPLMQSEVSLSLKDFLRGHVFGTSATMSRRVLELTGGSRPETYSEDPDLWMRALASGAQHRHMPKPVFLYYQDQATDTRITGNVRAIWASHIEILEHLLSHYELDSEERSLAKRQIRSLKVRLAIHWNAWGTPMRVARARRHRS